MSEKKAALVDSCEPFEEVWPRTEDRDRWLVQLGGRLWKLSLAQMYTSTGRYIPEKAKRSGCTFGFCDSEGRLRPMATATHVGWTV